MKIEKLFIESTSKGCGLKVEIIRLNGERYVDISMVGNCDEKTCKIQVSDILKLREILQSSELQVGDIIFLPESWSKEI